jgi:hypothetical protein
MRFFIDFRELESCTKVDLKGFQKDGDCYFAFAGTSSVPVR